MESEGLAKELNPLCNTWDDIAMPILRTLQEMEAEVGDSGIGPHIWQIAEMLAPPRVALTSGFRHRQRASVQSAFHRSPIAGCPESMSARKSGAKPEPSGRSDDEAVRSPIPGLGTRLH